MAPSLFTKDILEGKLIQAINDGVRAGDRPARRVIARMASCGELDGEHVGV
jgi:hypothetical protein